MKLTSPTSLALGAIALWGTLATLGVSLSHVPPFLLTGLALIVGSLVALPLSGFQLRLWRVPLPTLALGVYGLFGFHFLLFVALRHAPPVQANLVNYLWPLFMVVLAPVFLKGLTLRLGHWLGALLGFAGAAVAILGGASAAIEGTSAAWGWSWGYLPALGSAFIWASYSLLTKRVPAFPTAAIGGFALVSGLLSLLCHGLMEPSASLTVQDGLLILVMGLGPMGAAFFLWDRALKGGDARQIGLLSYLTPLVSTVLLIVVSGRALTWAIALAGVLIISGAWLGADKKQA
jgi:drug/metabolite transporter (DMT)-like permease